MPPTAAMDPASANAYSLTPVMLTPTAAAARSFVRTAKSRRPIRPAPAQATTMPTRPKMMTANAA